jgi:hypothetical protein
VSTLAYEPWTPSIQMPLDLSLIIYISLSPTMSVMLFTSSLPLSLCPNRCRGPGVPFHLPSATASVEPWQLAAARLTLVAQGKPLSSSLRSRVLWGHGGRRPNGFRPHVGQRWKPRFTGPWWSTLAYGFRRHVGQRWPPLRAARRQQHEHFVEHMETTHTLKVDMGRASMPSRMMPICQPFSMSKVVLGATLHHT